MAEAAVSSVCKDGPLHARRLRATRARAYTGTMRPTRPPRPSVLALALLLAGCSRTSQVGGAEETTTAESEVPLVVRSTAQRVCQRLGTATTGRWQWDEESQDWEVQVLGLTRQAELDILPDGRFSELELVHALAEVEAALPEIAATIHQKCRQESALIELSLRSEAHLDPLPDLKSAWALDAVVLEFQCTSGRDFELDARHLLLEDKIDDVEEAADGPR